LTKSRTFNEKNFNDLDSSSSGSSGDSNSGNSVSSDSSDEEEKNNIEIIRVEKKKMERRSTIVKEPIFDGFGKIVDFIYDKKNDKGKEHRKTSIYKPTHQNRSSLVKSKSDLKK